MLLLVNVDDCLLHCIGETATETGTRFINDLQRDYNLTIDDKIERFLGLNILWDKERTWVKISMEDKIEDMAKRLKLDGHKNVSRPMDPNFDSTPLPDDHVNCIEPFQSVRGETAFILHYRPDTAVANTKLSHFSQKHSTYHWKSLLHLCKYLHQTKTWGMFLRRSQTMDTNKIMCYALADAGELAASKVNSRTLVGHVLFLENNIISFKTKTTSVIPTDMCYAELIALYQAAKRLKATSNLFASLMPLLLAKPLQLYGDNLAALWVSRTKTNTTRTKHYDLKYKYIEKFISEELLANSHCPTQDNISDFLTKLQTRVDFERQRAFYVAERVEDLQTFVKPIFDKSIKNIFIPV